MSNYALRFGDFDMSPGSRVDGVSVEVYGLRRGRPVPVTRVVDSMLQDGAVERIDRHDNRDQTVIVGFKGDDLEALAAAEEALMVEVRKQRNELAWTPPSDVAATTVFDVLWSDLEFSDEDDWDLDELRGCRVWVLTLRAFPWARADVETVVPALATSSTPTTVTISDGTSATGWSSPYGSVTVSSGSLVLPTGNATSSWTDSFGNFHQLRPLDVTYTMAATDFTSTPHLSFEFGIVSTDWQFMPTQPKVFVDGIEVAEAGRAWTTTSGVILWNFIVLDPSATTIRIRTQLHTVSASTTTMRIDNVRRSNVAPSISSTGRETLRTVTVNGSAPTEGSMLVSHATTALGRAIVYTCPALAASGYSPPLRPYRSDAGSDTSDTATLSGTRSTGTPSFQVPAAQLPKGGYLLFLRARSTSGTQTRTFSWSAATKVGSTVLTSQAGSAAPVSLNTTDWQLVPVGGMVLPPTDVSANSSATVQITVSADGGSIEWDEALLFYMGDGAALTIVDCGTGTPSLGSAHNSLWICSPSIDQPAPRVLLGINGASETGFHAGEKAQSWGIHKFSPGEMLMFVATTGAANPEVPVRYFERAHTHVRRHRG